MGFSFRRRIITQYEELIGWIKQANDSAG